MKDRVFLRSVVMKLIDMRDLAEGLESNGVNVTQSTNGKISIKNVTKKEFTKKELKCMILENVRSMVRSNSAAINKKAVSEGVSFDIKGIDIDLIDNIFDISVIEKKISISLED